MSIGTVESILDTIQTVSSNVEIENSSKLVHLEINWKRNYIYFAYSDEYTKTSFKPIYHEIEKSFYDDSKDIFIKDLLDKIKRFSLLNTRISITICDIEHPEDDKTIFKTECCQTLCEKICQLTGLNKSKMLEIILPEYGAELYFFVLLNEEEKPMESLVITSNSFCTAVVNSLYVAMVASSKNLDNVSFIGKVGSSDHYVLKKLLKIVIRKLMEHLNKYENYTFDDTDTMFVDLTDHHEDENMEKDDDVFYDLNTSDIIETDHELKHFYNNDLKWIYGDWDTQVNIKKYYSKCTCDDELMQKFINDAEHMEAENNSTQCDVEIIECDNDTQTKQKSRKRNTTELSVDSKSAHTSSKYSKSRQTTSDVENDRQRKQRRTSVEKNKIKSNLFSEDEVEKWTKAKQENRSIISSAYTNNLKISTFDKNYKIPKLTPSGPSPRRPIHESQETSKRAVTRDVLSNRFMAKFSNRIRNVAPYNSPSSSRMTVEESGPDSISKFINSASDTCIIVDDDDDNNNNSKASINDSKQEANNSQNVPAKRKLLEIEPKIFKNRKTESTTAPENPFAPSMRSSTRRKY